MARPKKQIDRDVVERLANRQCPTSEIAAVVGCAVNTLKRRFGRHLPLWRERGKEIIRSKQWQAMEKGNTVMLIWLGKQYLNQADKAKIDLAAEPFDPLTAYAGNPDLRERALQLERDTHDANQALAPFDAGENRISGPGALAVPTAPPKVGGNGRQAADRPDVQPPGGPTPS